MALRSLWNKWPRPRGILEAPNGRDACSPHQLRMPAAHKPPLDGECGEGFVKANGTQEIWIFGFGSLIWKADFESSKRIEGYIKGFKRVFYQGSTDHRGTEGAPGRTATLIEDPNSVVPGAAYLLKGNIQQQQRILKELEWREKQYDCRLHVPVFSKADADHPVLPSALIYVATSSKANRNWLGEAPQEEIAQQIASAKGPSGPNYEYLYRLAEAVRKTGVQDEDLEWLEQRVKTIRSEMVPQQNEHINAS